MIGHTFNGLLPLAQVNIIKEDLILAIFHLLVQFDEPFRFLR